ncbi:hypothetical protein P5673_006222 [Acropora cervicornis]|uniref:Uncharacterized protein n=1 Tax=Acropora cervicornis TaxID=6130 RepID=A0AAD9QXF7_ACRCE|nr:hypothetical protein P5673_006222 [Acropora cervicornis]
MHGLTAQIPRSAVGNAKLPWIAEGEINVITAYFTNPQGICSGSRPASEYIGDQLLLQTGDDSSKTRAIPFKQEDLKRTKWVEGGCFLGMGRHYWYNISKDMDCKDFYPMFLLYNKKGRLTGFGWVSMGRAESSRYEHPPPNRLDVPPYLFEFLFEEEVRAKIFGIENLLHTTSLWGFFQSETKPKCIPKLKDLTTQHVYLDSYPYLNLCII